MRTERRDQQNLNLTEDTHRTYNSTLSGQNMNKSGQLDMFPSWDVRIGSRAQDKSSVFNNLMKHINKDTLHQAFKAVDGSKALGVDGISKYAFGTNLEGNIEDLVKRIQSGTYRPKPKREVLIPKANGKTRPIAISCFEDKLVDWVAGKIMSLLYEPMFIRNSFGYRPGKSADRAVKACYYSMEKNKRPYVFEIDFSSFFNTIPHRKLMEMIEKKIADKRFHGLIRRFLSSGILAPSGEELPSEVGTPQGSIMSPVLANIYLNEVIDQWFLESWVSYNNVIVRYADDAVFFFKREDDALKFKSDLEKRVEQFGLKLNEEKTKMIKLDKSSQLHFHFLGFTFYWGKQGSRRIFKVKTQKEKLIKAIMEFDCWIKIHRSKCKLKELWEIAKSKIRGHFNYYGFSMNNLKINHFLWRASKSLFKWLNRRSQKLSYSPEGFDERLKNFPLLEDFDKLKWKKLGRSFGTI
ncbi:MAG: group II intron reverse transcriptase/maturase [Candidatus Brocadiales bacterium]|nr:group II intron reverse transcriptase/maturase [Candidatus Brocadiales bacterium]